jgi:hypothetical protein
VGGRVFLCDWEGAVRVEGQALLGRRPEVLWIEVTDYLDFGKVTNNYSDYGIDAFYYSDFGKVTADYSDFGKVT